jgi:hypothetical protein
MHSVNSLTGCLTALGHGAPESAVPECLEWFGASHFLFTVPVLDASLARGNTNPKGIRCVEHSVVTSVSSGVLVNAGRLLGNLVFMALRRLRSGIHYHRIRIGRPLEERRGIVPDCPHVKRLKPVVNDPAP